MDISKLNKTYDINGNDLVLPPMKDSDCATMSAGRSGFAPVSGFELVKAYERAARQIEWLQRGMRSIEQILGGEL